MKIAKKFFAGALVAFVALAMTGSAFAYTHMGTLKAGSMGTQVMSLQSGLSSLGFLAGTADGKFGPMTGSALAAFQMSKGLTPDRVVGPKTGAALQLATATVVTPPTSGGFDLNTLAVGGKEATLEQFDVNSLDNASVMEGETDVEVYNADYEFDEDTLLERIDFIFVPEGGQSNEDPAEIFDKLEVKVGGKVFATNSNADDSDEYQDSTYDQDDVSISLTPTTGDLYSMRFNGRYIAKANTKTEISVLADMASSLDINDEWALVIPDEGARVTDPAALVQTMGNGSDADTFTLDAEGTDNKFTIREGDNNPDSSLLEVESSTKSKEHTVAVIEVEVDEESEDLEFKTMNVEVVTVGDTYANIVDTITLKVGSYEIEGDYVSGTTTSKVKFDFDSNDLIIDSGDKEDFEFVMKFNALSSYTAGDTVQVNVDVDGVNANMEAKGDDSNETVTDENGAVTGNAHELREDGVIVSMPSNAFSAVPHDGPNTGDDYAELTIKFDVEAIGQDIWVPNATTMFGSMATAPTITSTAPTAATTEGVGYSVQKSGGTATTPTATLTSTADEETSSFKVNDGDKETFTLKVIVPNTSGNLSARTVRSFLTGISWTNAGDSATSTDVYTLNLVDDFKTGTAYIND